MPSYEIEGIPAAKKKWMNAIPNAGAFATRPAGQQ